MNERSRRVCHKHKQDFKHLRTKSIPGEKKNGKKAVILLYEDFTKENVLIVLTKGKTSCTYRCRYQQSTLGRGMCITEISPEHLKTRKIGRACFLAVFFRLTNSKMIQEDIQTQPRTLKITNSKMSLN